MHMPHRNPSLRNLGRSAVATLLVAAASVTLHAQGAATPANVPSLKLGNSFAQPFNLAALSSAPDLGYSSSAGTAETAAATDFSFATSEETQPPPRRRRYGRPNYNDRMHNADGSNKFAAVVGAGLTIPSGNVSNFLNTSWKFQGGVGYNASKKFGVMAQFDWDNFGLPGNVINTQYNLYSNQGYTDGNGNPISFAGLDGHTHIWSLTLNPTFTFYDTDKVGAYAVVGGGFYHKVTNFTIPETSLGYSPFYGYYQYTANQSFDAYTSNAVGVNGGVGLTYKFSRFSQQKFFAEVRYVHTFNSYRSAAAAPLTNFYPANSLATDYLPITVGLRF